MTFNRNFTLNLKHSFIRDFIIIIYAFYHRSLKCILTELFGKSKIRVIYLDVSSEVGFSGQMEGIHHLHNCGNVSYNISGSSCCNGRIDSCSSNFVVAEIM